MVLIIISCDFVGSVHSMKQKFSEKDEDYEEEKKSLDKNEEAHF